MTPVPNSRLRVGPATYSKGGYISFGGYGNGEIAIQIVADDGEPDATATVNLIPSGAYPAGPGRVWLKGWAENEGIPEALEKAGICTLTGASFQVGHAWAQLAKLSKGSLTAIADSKNQPERTVV